MFLRKIISVFLAISLSATLYSCSLEKTSSSEQSLSSDSQSNGETEFDRDWTPAKESEGLPKMKSHGTTSEMIQRSIINEGNTARLANVMDKAKKGEEVTIVTIGGSITQGSSASNDGDAYANLLVEWWLAAFPENKKIDFYNAGIGATDSYIGVHRVQEDVLSHNPDLVVVEFSVNDTRENINSISYENLVRRLLSSDNNPAVILLFMTEEDGTNFQSIHSKTGFAYDLPMISYKNAVLPEIKSGNFTWQDISPDDIHPNTKGHGIIGELLGAYLNSILYKIDSLDKNATPFNHEPIAEDVYINGTILNSNNFEPIKYGSFEKADISYQFPSNWTTSSGEDSIIFEVEASNIGIMYYKTVDGLSGTYHVFIDGKLKGTLNGDFSGGWGNFTESIEVFKGNNKEKHKIEIKKVDSSKGNLISIIGLLVS